MKMVNVPPVRQQQRECRCPSFQDRPNLVGQKIISFPRQMKSIRQVTTKVLEWGFKRCHNQLSGGLLEGTLKRCLRKFQPSAETGSFSGQQKKKTFSSQQKQKSFSRQQKQKGHLCFCCFQSHVLERQLFQYEKVYLMICLHERPQINDLSTTVSGCFHTCLGILPSSGVETV